MREKNEQIAQYPDAERLVKVAKLWLQQQGASRGTDIDALNFYKWMQENHPVLLRRGQGDPYQLLKADLLELKLIEGS